MLAKRPRPKKLAVSDDDEEGSPKRTVKSEPEKVEAAKEEASRPSEEEEDGADQVVSEAGSASDVSPSRSRGGAE